MYTRCQITKILGTKEAAAEVSGIEDIPIEMNKKEAASELRSQVKEKWQRTLDFTEKVDCIQEIFIEVGKRSCLSEGDHFSFFII